MTPALRSGPLLLTAIMAVALVLRLCGLADQLMFDDAASWVFASVPWRHFVQVLWRFEGNMALYYTLLRGWLVFGDSEIAIRSLSVICGMVTVALTYAVGSRLWTRRAGLIAAGLSAVHPLLVQYSQEARGYPLEVMLLVLSTYLLILARACGSRAAWTGYVAAGALACYSHVLAVLGLAAQWTWLLGVDGWRPVLRRWRAALALALLVAPILLYVVLRDEGQIDWVPQFNRFRFTATVLQVVGGGYLLFVLVALLCAAGCFFAWHRHREQRTGLLLALLWLFLPIGLLALKSMSGKSMFVDRYLLLSLPPLLLLIALGADNLLRAGRLATVAGTAMGVAVLGLLLQATVVRYRGLVEGGNPFRSMTQYVLANQRAGDGLLFFTSQTLFSFQYYANRAGGTLPEVKLPDFGDVPTGAQRNPSADEVRRALQGAERIWLVVNLSGVRLVRGAKETLPIIRSTIEQDYVRVEERTADFLVVELYQRRAAATR